MGGVDSTCVDLELQDTPERLRILYRMGGRMDLHINARLVNEILKNLFPNITNEL